MVTNVQINLRVDELRCSYAAYNLLYDTGSMAVGNGTPLLIALALIGTSTSAAWSLVDPILERSVCYSSSSVPASESLV